MSLFYKDIFYRTATPILMDRLVKSTFWTPALGVHFATSNKLKILGVKDAPVTPAGSPHVITHVYFCNDEGFPVCALHTEEGQIQLSLTLGRFTPKLEQKPLVKTVNPRYITTVLNKAESEARKKLLEAVNLRSRDWWFTTCTLVLNSVMEKWPFVEVSSVADYSNNTRLLISDILAGDKTLSDLPPPVIQQIKNVRDSVLEFRTKRKQRNDEVMAFLGRERWVIHYQKWLGINVYSMDMTSLASFAQMTKYMSDTFKQPPVVVQPESYQSLADMPDEIRLPLEARLTMMKIYRDSLSQNGLTYWDTLLPTMAVPAQQLYDNKGEILPACGTTLRANHAEESFLLTIDKI